MMPTHLFRHPVVFLMILAALVATALQSRGAGHRDILVQAITNNDVAAQATLIVTLANQPDPVVEQTLTAWRQGAVYILEPEDKPKIPFLLEAATDATGQARGVAVATGEVLKDADGKPLLFTAAELTAADTSAKLRRAIKTTLDVLALSNANPNVRRDAATKLGQEQNPDYLPHFRDRLTNEQFPEVRKALAEAIALTELVDEKPAVRLAAVRALDAQRSIAALDFLVRMAAEARTNQTAYSPEMSAAILQARGRIERHVATSNFIETAFHGLSLSAVLLIAALGLAITFGLMGIINMAHGEMIMLGAYTAYLTQNLFIHWFGQGTPGFNWYFPVALPLSFLSAGCIGVILERGIIRHLYKRPLESLLATWGVSLVLQQGMRTLFGAANVQVYSPSWLTGNLNAWDVVFAYNRMFVIGFAVSIVVFTWLLLTKTSLGLQVRALMQNRQMAACMGVRTDRVNMATFAFGSGLAGMAGACLSQIGNIGPGLGQSHIVDCFMVVVLGGVGNLQGTVSAALGIGVTDQILQPHLGAVLGKITVLAAIILFLQWRPAGLFATRGRGLES